MRTPLRTLPIALALLAFALSSCVVRNQPPPPPIGGSGRIADIAGFAPGGHFMQQDQGTIRRELDGMARTGARWFRVGFQWSGMEATPGRYSFSKHDWLVNETRKRGIRIIANVSYTPKWARPGHCQDMMCPPANPAHYGRFMKALVKHFSPRGVKHYEIWNEPNQHFWWKPKPSPRGYTALLRAAYPNAKAADRGVTVIAGAFAPTRDSSDGRTIRSTTFVRNLYYNGAGRYFDAMSIHPYSGEVSPTTRGEWNMMTSVMPDIYRTMRSHGDGGKKIWGTESGYMTGGRKGISEYLQGMFLRQSYLLWAKFPYTAALITFNYRDMASSPRAHEVHFGLVRRNFSPKQSLAIFTQTMRMRQGTAVPRIGLDAESTESLNVDVTLPTDVTSTTTTSTTLPTTTSTTPSTTLPTTSSTTTPRTPSTTPGPSTTAPPTTAPPVSTPSTTRPAPPSTAGQGTGTGSTP